MDHFDAVRLLNELVPARRGGVAVAGPGIRPFLRCRRRYDFINQRRRLGGMPTGLVQERVLVGQDLQDVDGEAVGATTGGCLTFGPFRSAWQSLRRRCNAGVWSRCSSVRLWNVRLNAGDHWDQ